MAYADIEKKKENDRKKTKRKYGTQKYRARDVLRHAVASGRIKKPSLCSVCAMGGRIEGHHDDYEKPLEAIWLCQVCHRKRHGDLFIKSGAIRRNAAMKSQGRRKGLP